jgi:hypothetical protein
MTYAGRRRIGTAPATFPAGDQSGFMRPIIIPMLALLSLGGCSESGSAISSLSSAGVAAAVGAAINPGVGLVAGVLTAYGFDQGVKYGERRTHGNVQQAIADAAGPLGIGEAAAWQVTEELPLSGRSGTVQVARSFGAAIPCKDVVFTVEDDGDLYAATLCRNGAGPWRWATAEPTVRRWGTLQ